MLKQQVVTLIIVLLTIKINCSDIVYTQVSASANGKNLCLMPSGGRIIKSYSQDQVDQIRADLFWARERPSYTVRSANTDFARAIKTRVSSASEVDTRSLLLQKVGGELHKRPFLRQLLGL